MHDPKTVQKQAILAVSFGTRFAQTRKKTIDRIEADIRAAYPQYSLYRAFTSRMIIQKLKQDDGISVDNVTEAMQRMASEGVTHVIVQPTHILDGVENNRMKEDVRAFAASFRQIRFGAPLLSSAADIQDVIGTLLDEWGGIPSDEAVVFMGHGTSHHSNTVYASLARALQSAGYPNLFLGTVEAAPSIDILLEQTAAFAPGRVHLAPFMIVAGDHAQNDLAGDGESSWKSRFLSAGFPVACHLKGLGEYEGVRRIFLRHISEAKTT